MAVPDTLHFAVLQEARKIVLALKDDTAIADDEVIVPRRGAFADGSEIRDTEPEPPYLFIDHSGQPSAVGQASRYKDAGDLVYEKPYTSTIQLDGYGRASAESLSRVSIAARQTRFPDVGVSVYSTTGAQAMPQLGENVTREANYRMEFGVNYMAVLRLEDQAAAPATTLTTDLEDIPQELTKTVTVTT